MKLIVSVFRYMLMKLIVHDGEIHSQTFRCSLCENENKVLVAGRTSRRKQHPSYRKTESERTKKVR